MKIVQILPTISYGDAIGNNAIAIKKLLKSLRYQTEIYAENIDIRLPKNTAKYVADINDISNEDVIIYHLSTGTELSYILEKFSGRKVLVYHNITPPVFFQEYSEQAAGICAFGLDGLKYLADKVEYCLADSTFNKQELIECGYNCDIDVVPILINFDDYNKDPDQKVIEKYKGDGYVNWIFTGRIAPNKKQEDVIGAYYYYHTYINPKSRLILVGSYKGMEGYYRRLINYVEKLEIEDVIFTGHVKFDEVLAYYKIADVFVCMSEHEGFCVPLIEAMLFNIPIIAYNSSAIKETLGGSGLLIDEKEACIVAGMTEKLLKDENLKQKILHNQRVRLKDFSSEIVSSRFHELIRGFLNESI